MSFQAHLLGYTLGLLPPPHCLSTAPGSVLKGNLLPQHTPSPGLAFLTFSPRAYGVLLALPGQAPFPSLQPPGRLLLPLSSRLGNHIPGITETGMCPSLCATFG